MQGRLHSGHVFTQRSLGFFKTALDAGAAFTAAADAAKASGELGDGILYRDPITPMLTPDEGEGGIDMHAMFKKWRTDVGAKMPEPYPGR